MMIKTHISYPLEAVPPAARAEETLRFLLAAGWIDPRTYGDGEPDTPLPKSARGSPAAFVVRFFREHGEVVLEEKRGLQLIFSPPQPRKAGSIVWTAPSSHPGLHLERHVAAVWEAMRLVGTPLAEAMSKEEHDHFSHRLIPRDGYQERAYTVLGYENGLRHAFWRLWFGAPYLRFFGAERLDAAPAFCKKPLEPEGRFVQVYDAPESWDEPDVLEACRAFERSLGRRAFYDSAAPDALLETPDFGLGTRQRD